MELFMFIGGCFVWHILIVAVGVWLGMAKPWRLARDYDEFRQWQEQQQRRQRPGDDVFAEVR